MEKLRVLFKVLPTLTMLLAVGEPASEAEAAGVPPVPAETASASTLGLPAPQSSVTAPLLDSSPFVPDGPEKAKRVKKLLDQITATYGFNRGREQFSPAWGPRPGKLYALHKKLIDDDWKLLAEMYVSFVDSDSKSFAGIYANCNDHDAKYCMRFENSIKMLLAMHGEASINAINIMVASASRQSAKYKEVWRGFEMYNDSWQWRIDRIKMFSEDKSWSDTSEYKKDQLLGNRLSK
jgi:hypothetical protein